MRTLIRNVDVVLPQGERASGLLIEDDVILGIDPPQGVKADEVIDGNGNLLLPGVIDAHVHFRDPGLTHKEDIQSGSRACAVGGVTTFFDMPNTDPPVTTVDRLNDKLALGARKSLVNYGFYIGATADNLAELQAAERTPGIKLFIGSSTGGMQVESSEAIDRIFAETTLPVATHCEDDATILANRKAIEQSGRPLEYADHSRIRDVKAAERATREAIRLARKYRHRLHVMHVSTGVEAGLFDPDDELVTAEVCPHHLMLTEDAYSIFGARVQMNPSVKTQADCNALWKALRDGRLSTLGTDHAPHTLEEKERPYPDSPSGVPGVENSLRLMLSAVEAGDVTVDRLVEMMCVNPARIFNVRSKGAIVEGYDADLVLVDLEQKWVIRDHEQVTKCRWSPYSGMSGKGDAVATCVMGQWVYREGKIDASVRGREVLFDHSRPSG